MLIVHSKYRWSPTSRRNYPSRSVNTSQKASNAFLSAICNGGIVPKFYIPPVLGLLSEDPNRAPPPRHLGKTLRRDSYSMVFLDSGRIFFNFSIWASEPRAPLPSLRTTESASLNYPVQAKYPRPHWENSASLAAHDNCVMHLRGRFRRGLLGAGVPGEASSAWRTPTEPLLISYCLLLLASALPGLDLLA